MTHQPQAKLDVLLRRLEKIVAFTPEEVAAILALPLTVRNVGPGQEIVREGDRPSQSCLVLDGVSCRFRVVGDGSRQIFSFHIQGDIPDLQSLYLERMDHSLLTLTRSTLAFIPHRALHHLVETHPRVGGYLWRETLVDGSIFREWMSNIGRRPALSRIAHLICEMYTRYRAIGLVDGQTFPFPLTQPALGDAQGLSVVHVNRVLKQLKTDKLIRIGRRQLTILDWDGLVAVGDFDREYLHLPEAA